MKELFGKEIKFAYIDLQLSKAIAIGFSVNNEVKEHLKKLFRVKNIELYSSYDEWINKIGSKVGQKQLIVKDEFDFRALNAASLSDKKLQFNKIMRS